MSGTYFIIALVLLVGHVQGRQFELRNQCAFPVWFGFVSGSSSVKLFPADHDYKLEANGGKKTVDIPAGGWSGVIGGRTDCTDTGCVTADCGGGVGDCIHGFNQPATQAEFTVVPNGVDFYDVEVINGVNIPVSITPSVLSNGTDPYYCGAPGAATPSPGLGACSWNLEPPLPEYNWVDMGGASCESQSDCGSGTTCGLSFNPGHQQLLQKTCGKRLGYWSADQICGVQRDYGAPFYCSDAVPGSSRTWWNYYACVDVDSCYQPFAQADCCGCVNWDEEGLEVPKSPLTRTCVSKNQNWIDRIFPTLFWLKQACPSAYTYPYDDMSSTYTCQDLQSGVNEVSYTVTFCPEQKA